MHVFQYLQHMHGYNRIHWQGSSVGTTALTHKGGCAPIKLVLACCPVCLMLVHDNGSMLAVCVGHAALAQMHG
jgi:hypothetical protein